MSSEQSTDEVGQYRKLPKHWWAQMVNEWNSRTLYGKLFYPFWLAAGGVVWTLVLLAVFILEMNERFALEAPNTHKRDR